jgi:hypothetical protein
MAELVPATHVFGCGQEGVDARIKSGHYDQGAELMPVTADSATQP